MSSSTIRQFNTTLSNIFILVKSFSALSDAERFIAGENLVPSGDNGVSQPAKFYAVKCGRVPGIYMDWPSAQEQITGWQKPKHRCFSTRVEAQRFLDEDGGKTADISDPADGEGSISTIHRTPDGTPELGAEQSTYIKVKSTPTSKPAPPAYHEADFEPGTGPLPPDAEDGFDSNIIFDAEQGGIIYKTQEQRQATRSRPSSSAQTEPIRIHTDGSSLGNGQIGAFAGVGVYFGPGDKRLILP